MLVHKQPLMKALRRSHTFLALGSNNTTPSRPSPSSSSSSSSWVHLRSVLLIVASSSSSSSSSPLSSDRLVFFPLYSFLLSFELWVFDPSIFFCSMTKDFFFSFHYSFIVSYPSVSFLIFTTPEALTV